ncbi:nitrite/sulfite reductase [Actinomadura sp.]|jgi:sulfite reductase (ferredoxin)|uniref:nitrite/sulfite reductase n=1 Tax=Actinomadura sp. TaxID=1989 RepID=UPI0037CB8E13
MRTRAVPPAIKRKKGEGQWALGYREPLNATEENKKNDDGLNVRRRIIDIYSKRGFDSIDPSDLRGRFRWMGLYTQRRPGIDGGRTGALEDEEIEDRYFMMRIRIDGGQLSGPQLRTIADISRNYARGTADITNRHNIQLHWVGIEDVPAIWDALAAVGLHTTEACGDVPRTIIGCPLAGIAADEVIDATPQLREIHDRYIGSPEFSNLPRKYKTALSGCASHCTVHEINDIAFVGVVNEQGETGYQLFVGGGLSTNPMFSRSLGVFVKPEQAHEVWHGVTSIFRDYGYRRLRSRARLKFLMKDWGAEKFREVLEKEYLGYALPDGPEPAAPDVHRDHLGVHPQKGGGFYVGFAPRVGRLNGELLGVIGELADRYGSGRVRTTLEQKMIILDVPEENTEALVEALAEHDLHARPSTFRRHMMACTGIEYCKLAIVDTKQRAMDLMDELEKRLPDFDQPLTVNVNGCPNSCARVQVADIGLKGQLVVDENGDQVEGFQVHLGGRLGQSFGKKVRGLKTTSAGLTDYIERVVRRFDEQRAEGETFADWVQRADDADLK